MSFLDLIAGLLSDGTNLVSPPRSKSDLQAPLPKAFDGPKSSLSGGSGSGSDGIRTRDLEDRLARQALVLQTLVATCIQKGVFTGPEFNDLMIEIDSADGVRDGRARENRSPKVCPSCENNNNFRAMTCMYCGSELGQGVST